MLYVLGLGVVFLLLIGLPLFIAFLLISVITLIIFLDVPLIVVMQNLFGSINKFALMAIPFFVLGGNVMSNGGLTSRITDWARTLVGFLRGGFALTTVLASIFFGAISGSSPATVAAIGKNVYPLLKKEYGEKFSLGLISSTGGIAIVIPPSINLLVYASVTGASVGALFIAGILPGVLFGLLIAGWVLYYSFTKNVKAESRLNLKEILLFTKKGIWALGTPAIILGGIYTGIFTPTEAAAVAAVYAIIVSMFVYREMDLAGLMETAKESALVSSMIFIIIAAAGVFSWILTVGQGPQKIAQLVAGLNLSYFGVLLLLNVVFLVAGMFMDPSAAVAVLVPLFFPMAVAASIDPTHLGIICAVNFAIGMFSPPFGLNIYVCSGILKEPVERVISGLIPFLICSLITLLLVTYLPKISLWLPGILLH